MMNWIYVIRNNIDSKCYIGVTSQPERRWDHHKTLARTGNERSLYVAMREYGVENFYFELLASCISDPFGLEIEMIAQFNSYKHGYNMTPGGLTNCATIKSHKTSANKGKVVASSTVSGNCIGWVSKEDPRFKTGEIAFYNETRKMTEETKKKIGKHSKERNSGASHPLAKTFKLTDPDGNCHIVTGGVKALISELNLSETALLKRIGLVVPPMKNKCSEARSNTTGWKLEEIK